MPQPVAFIAYPSQPQQVGAAIDAAVRLCDRGNLSFATESWREIDIPGRFIIDGILDRIGVAHFVVADITRLNFNVTFEVGYALGRGKRVVLVLDRATEPETKEITQLGIFDTLGYAPYSNAQELFSIIKNVVDNSPPRFAAVDIDRSAPIYVLDTFHKTDAALRIISRIKKSRLHFRSFDPKEQPRLATSEAIRNVRASIAVVVNLLSSNSTDHRFNNLRGAFLAGLAMGGDKETLVLQEGEEPVPVDYRDLVRVYRHPDDIDPLIAELVPKVTERLQEVTFELSSSLPNLLERINLGAPAAENEASILSAYYVATDEYNKALSGMIRLAVGRKGSGKTALFFRLRDKVRNNRQNVVIDLKPDGYQLKRFKFMVLDVLQEAVKEHVATAFWEYVLLLEICYKLLEKDREVHTRNHTIYEPYRRLASLYETDALIAEGDFSERMLTLVHRISDEFTELHGKDNVRYLSANGVTQLIYKHDIPKLRRELTDYLQHKKQIWILFDNLDKGWPTRGVEPTDIVILRALLDAARKIEQMLARDDVEAHSIVFVRNDVYEHLVDRSPDRGKHGKVSLDWTDPDLLREFLRRRIVYGVMPQDEPFQKAWSQICVSHVRGEDSSEYLIQRSLLRPRNLLTLLTYAKSNAVNLGHTKISDQDIDKACRSYSADLGNDIGLEIRDVFPDAEDVLYYFIDARAILTISEIKEKLSPLSLSPEKLIELIEMLLWFAFFGVLTSAGPEGSEVFIYDVQYDMKKLRVLAKGLKGDAVSLSIHHAFRPFLEIPK
jgi:hypothetical protein